MTSEAAALPDGFVQRLELLRGRSRKLSEALSASVIGQDAAVAMLVNAYFRACLGYGGTGPRGIFTFLGPAGVGKTLLAESFAQALQSLEQDPIHFRRFDMSTYAGHQAHEQLFGVAAFYRDASAGTLTGFVKEHPRSVLLFDEIEKAHDNTILALLAVLDKGEIEDKKLESVVSFRDTWCIFTTNLGREFFGSRNQSGVLRSGADTSAFVFDLLGSARRAREIAAEGSQPALSPEFVSRLAKGSAVIFSPLETRHYMQIVDQTIRRQLEAARQASGIPLPAVTIDDQAKLLFLMSLLPRIDARQAVARAGQWALDLIQHSYEDLRPSSLLEPVADYRLDVACSADTEDFLQARLGRRPLQILVVDDHDFLPALIESECAEFRPDVTRTTTEEETRRRVARGRPDLVLIDLSIGEEPGSSAVDKAIGILRGVRDSDRTIPVLLFSENPQDRSAFAETVARTLRIGGARGFLPCNVRTGTAIDREDFIARVEEMLREVRYERLLKEEARAHRTVRWDTECELQPAEARLRVTLARAVESVVVSAEDLASPIRFSGVPGERFADVAGLSRAKRRLEQVLGWLREPDRLHAFGVRPPRGFLLAGPPGTGKTLLARALAGEAGLPFLALSAGELESKWVGESEARVRELFERASEYSPSIVFIDEIDSLGSRSQGVSSPHATHVLNQLLSCMDGFGSSAQPVFVLAATNNPEGVDPALRRPGRFDEVIPIDRPAAADREVMLRMRLTRMPVEGDCRIADVVRGTAGMTPAELDRIVREAAYLAAGEGRAAVRADDLERARLQVRFGAQREGLDLRPEDRRRTAYHEAGHTVAHLALFPGSRIDHLTIVPNESGALGFLAPEEDERKLSVTRAEVEAHICIALAGRQAELLLGEGNLDTVSTGAASDLERASRLAWMAITRWGLDPEFGASTLPSLPDAERGPVAEVAYPRLRAWIERGEERSAALLADGRSLLDLLASSLLARESLEWKDLEGILRGAD